MIDEPPPSAAAVEQAISGYVDAVRARYGEQLFKIMLFGSRARGDAGPESDADIAVIIEDGDWSFWTEKMALSRMAYEQLMEFGLAIQPWPIKKSEWETPADHHNPRFVENIKRDARAIEVAA